MNQSPNSRDEREAVRPTMLDMMWKSLRRNALEQRDRMRRAHPQTKDQPNVD